MYSGLLEVADFEKLDPCTMMNPPTVHMVFLFVIYISCILTWLNSMFNNCIAILLIRCYFNTSLWKRGKLAVLFIQYSAGFKWFHACNLAAYYLLFAPLKASFFLCFMSWKLLYIKGYKFLSLQLASALATNKLGDCWKFVISHSWYLVTNPTSGNFSRPNP
jgi:hypothetical protein